MVSTKWEAGSIVEQLKFQKEAWTERDIRLNECNDLVNICIAGLRQYVVKGLILRWGPY